MGRSIRVLIAEDSEDDAVLLVRELRRANYDVASQRVSTPGEFLAALGGERWDIVFSDSTMPEFEGTSGLRLLQKSGYYIPLIILSGTISEEAAVAALRAGAAGFVRKHNLKNVVPVVRRELRSADLRRERLLGGDQSVAISSEADIMTARRIGYEVAALLEFPGRDAALIVTAISELARNIVLYARRGNMILSIAQRGGKRGLSVIAHDNGPGIPDVEQALTEGYSTSGRSGMGLPGVKLVVDEFDIASGVGRGTTVKIRKWKGP